MRKTWVLDAGFGESFLFSYFMFLEKQIETTPATRVWKSKLWKNPTEARSSYV